MNFLLTLNILLPLIAAIVIYFVKNKKFRNVVVLLTALAVMTASVLIWANGTETIKLDSIFGFKWSKIIEVADLLLGLYILYISISVKNIMLVVLSLLQIIPMFIFENFFAVRSKLEIENVFYIDHLSIVLNLIISIVGTLIWLFATSYMERHEERNKVYPSRQNRFFFVMMMFIGAMNALVFSNDIIWVYFFWEVTTLCSFLLIGHDGTVVAKKSAVRALLLNSIGGVAFVAAIILSYYYFGTMDIQKIIAMKVSGAALIPIVFLLIACFTKSAQMPFQSWLLGAMVAPTPVSALLHSSTMVKAGVYLALRLAPVYRGTYLSTGVAVFGAFTFVTASLLAIGESNGKRILAFSTIANLGLIIAAAGINTPASIAAGILLIIFHAISKSLLFMCVGTIELEIGSRDIEDMRGLFTIMPHTTIVTCIGLVTMLLPPFGVLLSKWLVLETASTNPALVFMIAIGSALTVLYYARWIGILLSETKCEDKIKREKQDIATRVTLDILAVSSIVVSLFVTVVFNALVAPEVKMYYQKAGIIAEHGDISLAIGGFSLVPVFIAMAVAVILGYIAIKRTQVKATPYMCGITIDQLKSVKINNVLHKDDAVVGRNYYFHDLFSADKLMPWADAIAIVIMICLFGVILL